MAEGPRITYTVNAKTDEANRALRQVESQGQKAGDSTAASFRSAGATIETSVRTSTRALDRMLDSIEKKSREVGRTQLESQIARVKEIQAAFGGSDSARYDRATAALQRFEAQQRRVDEVAAKAQFGRGLEAAQAASQRATAASDRFQAALVKVNNAHKAEESAIESKIRSLEREAALKGKTGSARTTAQAQQFAIDNPNLSAEQGRRAAVAFEQMGQAATSAEAPVGGLFARIGGGTAIAAAAAAATLKLGLEISGLVKESALYAARTQQLKIAQDAVAASSHISASALEAQVQQVEALNISQQDARLGVLRLAAANIDYTKAAQIARIAQNAGRVANITTAESFERLVHGLTTAQPELLRALGLNVSFEQAYAKMGASLGKTANDLTEAEKRLAGFNALVEAGSRIDGVYAASSKTVSGQLLSMHTFLDKARQVLGDQFLPLLEPLVARTVEWAKALPDAIKAGRELLDTVLAPMNVILSDQKIFTIVFDVVGRAAGRDLSPQAIIDFIGTNFVKGSVAIGRPFGAALRGASLGDEFDKSASDDLWTWLTKTGAVQRRKEDLASRRETGESEMAKTIAAKFLADQQNTLFSVQQRLAGLNAQRDNLWKSINDALSKGGNPETLKEQQQQLKANFAELTKLEAQQKSLQKAEALPEQRRELEITAAKDAATAWGKAWGVIVGGQESAYEKAAARLQQLREEHKLTDAIAKNIMRQADAESFIARLELARKQRGDAVEKMTAQADAFMKSQDELTAAQNKYRDESTAIWEKAGQERVAIEEASLSRSRDAELRKLDLVRGYSVSEKVAVEQQKLAIEQEYLNKSQALQRDKLDREISDLQRKAFGGAADDVDLAVRFQAIDQYKKERMRSIESQGTSDMSKVRDDAAIKQVQIISDAWQRQYDSLKRGFEGLFDSALTGGRNFFDSLRRIALGAFLTPVKEAFANWAASFFLPLFGARVNGSSAGRPPGSFGGGFGGGLGQLAGLGAIFSGTGTDPRIMYSNGGGGGGNAALAQLMGIGGGFGGYPATTPPFVSGASTGKFGGFGNVFSLAGAKGFLSQLGNIGYGPKGGDFGGEVAGSYRGVGGTTGGLMLAGGGMLAFDGLRRGGWLGVGETTAGGALIGAKFGGPIGAVIGAAVGFTAGLVRLFIKGAEEKMIEKVKAKFGVTVDRSFAKTLVEQSKAYGSIDLFLSAQQTRDMIWLYAEMTNQKNKSGLVDNTPRGVFLQQQGGSIYQSGVYSGGQAYGYGSSLPSIGTLLPMTPQNVYVSIQADGQATSDLMKGEAVNFINNNPRVIQAASNVSASQSSGRLTAAANYTDPLATTI
ncbi:MAG: hypothetical protein QM757_26725 [Paludibaculum sp.]